MPQSAKSAIGKPGVKDSNRSGLRLEPSQFLIDALARLDERALRRNAGEIVELMKAARQPHAGPQHLIQNARGARAGLGHIDVRIGAVSDQRVGVLHHRARDVRVQVEARDHAARARPPSRARAAGARPRRRRRSRPPSRRAGPDRRVNRHCALRRFTSSLAILSKASAVTCAEGLAAPHAVPTRRWPERAQRLDRTGRGNVGALPPHRKWARRTARRASRHPPRTPRSPPWTARRCWSRAGSRRLRCVPCPANLFSPRRRFSHALSSSCRSARPYCFPCHLHKKRSCASCRTRTSTSWIRSGPRSTWRATTATWSTTRSSAPTRRAASSRRWSRNGR